MSAKRKKLKRNLLVVIVYFGIIIKGYAVMVPFIVVDT
jgi:hypothetical protein